MSSYRKTMRQTREEMLAINEAKYDLYHKDFSSAMQHAYKMAKKLHGITVDPKEIDDKVATGPSKPSEGKTNKYRLKGDKGAIQVQVYNKGGSKPFELNMYKEEVKLQEKPADFIRLTFNSPADVKKAKKWMDQNLPGADQGFTFMDASGKDIDFENVDDAEDLMAKLKKAGFKFKVDYREEVELDEGYEGEVVKVLKKAKIASYFSNNILYVEKGDGKDAMAALKKAPNIKELPKIREEKPRREEVDLDESKKALKAKSEKSGVSVGILSKVYDRGMAAYKTGHRPGTTPQQWALARVNSFLTGGGARKADADLWKQAKGQKEEVELDELTFKIKNGVVHMSRKEYINAPSDSRGTDESGAPTLNIFMNDDDEEATALPVKFVESVEVDEASARADAMRAMRRGKSVDPADVDTDASDDDVKSASKNIMMQLRKSVSLRGQHPVEFMDKKKVKIPQKIAQAVLNKHNSFRKPMDKEKFQAKVSKSHKDLLSALKEGLKKKEETILDRIDSKLKERKNG